MDDKKIRSSPPFSRQEPVSWRAREVVGGVVPGSGSKVHTMTRTKCSGDLDSVEAQLSCWNSGIIGYGLGLWSGV